MGDTNTEGVERTATTDPLVGRRLASYEVLARVARGGMGVVYRARHVYIDKIVALKVLDPALAEREDLIERFRVEAQSLARVEHDNVVKVIDILEDGGVHFIVMDFAEGTNLRNYVRNNGPMGGDELLSVARQTAEALYAAHRQDILHRDIKPENLIMNARGRCKLADFGLAGDMRLISEGHEGPVNFGTPAYSAPEVLRRMVPDKRSDIFSYGATLYFLATGEPPFGQTDSRSVMLRQKQGGELLDARRADLPGKLSKLVMDCIAYHPKDRPDGFREVMDRLPRRFIPRPVDRTATAPTEPIDFDSGTHETPDGTATPKLAIASVVAGVLAVALVLTLWLWPGEAQVNNTMATEVDDTPAEDPSPVDDVPPADDEVENGNDGPAFRPEDEAFSNAELESREALGNADYRAACAAWAKFLRAHPDSEYADDARRRQRDVVSRVRELREKAYDKAFEAAREALEERRTAEAMAAIDRFPEELLVPLSDSDEVGVASRLDTQRRVIEAADANDLATVMQQADRLRTEWNDGRNDADLSEIRRMRSAGNLLEERELLEGFLPGRLAETREKVEARLKSLRKLLESAHQDAMAPVEALRRFHDQVLGEWAVQVLGVIGELSPMLERRQFEQAIDRVDELTAELRRLRDGEAKAAGDSRVSERIARSEFVIRLLGRYAEDLKLARDAFVSVESALRLERRSNNVREYLVHSRREEDGSLAARLDRVSGRVVSVAGDEFVVLSDDGRRTLKMEFLTANTVRKLIRARGDFDDQLRLVAWLTAQGRDLDAEVEFARLERLDNVPGDVVEQGRALVETKRLAPGVVRRLRYLAVRTGLREPADLEAETLEARLAEAQAGVEAGDAGRARTYSEIVNGIADPEMVNLETFERALELVDATENDLRMRVLLEPLHPAAHAALAERLRARGADVQARQAAGRALLLDPSNELAFRIRSN